MEINWTIEQPERQTETGGVITAHCRVNATDGHGYSAGSHMDLLDLRQIQMIPDFIPLIN